MDEKNRIQKFLHKETFRNIGIAQIVYVKTFPLKELESLQDCIALDLMGMEAEIEYEEKKEKFLKTKKKKKEIYGVFMADGTCIGVSFSYSELVSKIKKQGLILCVVH